MTKKQRGRLVLLAPLSGPIIPITEVPDPTFSQKMVGDGISIDPISETLLSPCSGKVTLLHKSHHALTITTDEGIEILIHIGLETVSLKGQGFSPHIQEGDHVKPGEALISFDADFLAKNAGSLLTQMVISNGEKVFRYLPEKGQAIAGETTALELDLSAPAEEELIEKKSETAESEEIVILNPQGLHARPTAVLTNGAKRFHSEITIEKQGKFANAKSVVAIMGLDIKNMDKVKVKAQGSDAKDAVESLTSLIKAGLGESFHGMPAQKEAPSPLPVIKKSSDPNILTGVPASPGLAAGIIFQLRQVEIRIDETGLEMERERKNFLLALNESKKELGELQNRLRLSADVGKAAIFAAHQEILDDPDLLSNADQGISEGKSAAFSWHRAYMAQADVLRHLNNELLAGRANDIMDVGRRVLTHLIGEGSSEMEIPQGSILIAEDLTPSDTVALQNSQVLGFCTTGGGATSHVAILARAAGIPAIAAIDEKALAIPSGSDAILDAEKGELKLKPSAEELERVRTIQKENAEKREKDLAQAAQAAQTKDGQRIKVVANISGLSEAQESVTLGGEGVGLLRSEFLFLQRSEAPSEEEQASVYTAIAKTLGPDRDLIVRTLDVGGDKPLSYMPLPPEVNPFLGVRGIRLNMLWPDIFRSQIRAILTSAPFSRLHIMFPMVSTVEEIKAARSVVEEEKQGLGVTQSVSIGIMVEVPSAAILAEGLAAEVDFFSIGTNDLTQYTLAIDRGHPRLAKMADGLHPAVLSLIEKTVKGAQKHGKWVGVCGGLAGETAAIPILLGLGVNELSVSVSAVPTVKAAIRNLDLSECRNLAQQALLLLSAGEVRTLAGDFLNRRNQKGGSVNV